MDAKKCSWVGSALLVGPRAAICAHPATTPVASASPSLTAFFDLGSRASHLTHHANVPPGLTDIPSSHSRLVRSRLNTLYLRISRRRRPSRSPALASGVGVWHALLLPFWRPLYTLQDERILRSLLILLYLRSGGDEWAGE